MTGFKHKQLATDKTLAEILKDERVKAEFSIEQVASLSGTSIKFVTILEAGEYDLLPGEIYAKQFIKNLCQLYHLNERKMVNLYQKEKGVQMLLLEPQPLKEKAGLIQKISPKIIRNSLITLVALAFFSYFGWEILTIFSPPNLTIVEPADQTTTSQPFIEITGQTKPESTVTINEQEIILKEDGSFSETVNLVEGLNTFIIESHRSHSRKSSQILSILKTDPGPQVNLR